ncbi:MAG: hypothetical protein WBA11_08065 [Rubrivirga sp.]
MAEDWTRGSPVPNAAALRSRQTASSRAEPDASSRTTEDVRAPSRAPRSA